MVQGAGAGKLQPIRSEDDPLGELRRRLDLDRALDKYAEQRWSGRLARKPTLCLDDFSAIPFLDVTGAEEYQHRARLRAGDGDLFAAVTSPVPGYEEYCQDLGLGSATRVQPSARFGKMRVARALQEEPAFSSLVDAATANRGLTIHPYMSIESVWELGRRLAQESKAPIEILGPPPPVMWVANDKSTLNEAVTTLLGADWLVETVLSSEPDAMAASLAELSTRHSKVGLKRLRCASASGNRVFESATLTARSRESIRDEVDLFLEHTQWDGLEPVQTVAWEVTDLSPSTQVWIPPAGSAEPRLDGVYEQILTGDEGIFVGSRPSTLPATINRRLGEAALKVARGFQALGYVGRCSFDHLVLGDPDHHPRLVFTECNGRWGGTSIPMSLVDRVVSGSRPGRRPLYRAQDFVHRSLVGASFADILESCADELFDVESGRGKFIFYNVGPLAEHGKLDVIAFGKSHAAAQEALQDRLPHLLGL